MHDDNGQQLIIFPMKDFLCEGYGIVYILKQQQKLHAPPSPPPPALTQVVRSIQEIRS